MVRTRCLKHRLKSPTRYNVIYGTSLEGGHRMFNRDTIGAMNIGCRALFTMRGVNMGVWERGTVSEPIPAFYKTYMKPDGSKTDYAKKYDVIDLTLIKHEDIKSWDELFEDAIKQGKFPAGFRLFRRVVRKLPPGLAQLGFETNTKLREFLSLSKAQRAATRGLFKAEAEKRAEAQAAAQGLMDLCRTHTPQQAQGSPGL